MSILVLNVGGVRFTTRRDTLCLGFFSGLLNSLDEDETEVFIDRDPTHFRYILNWLRGCRYIPKHSQQAQELLWEADFFGLGELVAKLKVARAYTCTERYWDTEL
jgi:hypothetical protein